MDNVGCKPFKDPRPCSYQQGMEVEISDSLHKEGDPNIDPSIRRASWKPTRNAGFGFHGFGIVVLSLVSWAQAWYTLTNPVHSS